MIYVGSSTADSDNSPAVFLFKRFDGILNALKLHFLNKHLLHTSSVATSYVLDLKLSINASP